jgi:hypothetical protein
MLEFRAMNHKLVIDRSTFFAINDPRILRLSESNIRPVNKIEFDRFVNKTQEGISNIFGLTYYINESNGFVDVYQFFTETPEPKQATVNYDLKNGPNPFFTIMSRRARPAFAMKLL